MLIVWYWTLDSRYRTRITDIKSDPENRILNLTTSPNAPLFGLLSRRFLRQMDRSPEPIRLDVDEIDRSFTLEATRFLDRHAGIDLKKSTLIEPRSLRMRDQVGFVVDCPAVLFWADNVVGACAPGEWDINTHYYVDRVLLETELRHHCTLQG